MIHFFFLAALSHADEAFLESLYVEYRRLLYACALQILREPAAAEDAVSDAIIALSTKIDLLRTLEGNTLKAYIVTTVKHVAISAVRKRSRQRNHMADDAEELLATLPGEGIEEQVLARAELAQVREAINRLPERERAALTLKVFAEMDDSAIADALGIERITVRVHISRARKRLINLLQEGGDSNAP